MFFHLRTLRTDFPDNRVVSFRKKLHCWREFKRKEANAALYRGDKLEKVVPENHF